MTKEGGENTVFPVVVHLTLQDDNKTWQSLPKCMTRGLLLPTLNQYPQLFMMPSQESENMGLLIGPKRMGEAHILTTSLALCRTVIILSEKSQSKGLVLHTKTTWC